MKWIDAVLSGKSDGITKSVIPQTPLVLEGLGLLLRQGDNRIEIEGKIDPEVPKEFRDVRFGRPPAFIVALNEKNYDSLDAFVRDFASIKNGTRYTIEFSVRGRREKYETTR